MYEYVYKTYMLDLSLCIHIYINTYCDGCKYIYIFFAVSLYIYIYIYMYLYRYTLCVYIIIVRLDPTAW